MSSSAVVANLYVSVYDYRVIRIGTGFDAHSFTEGRPLILGGVAVPHDKGLSGHSDADVLLHAICDALLGALAMGDIGSHFPDTDPKYKDASSLDMLNEVALMVGNRDFRVNNIDSVVIAQEPKIAPFVERMQKKISEAVGTDLENVSVKATTTEGMGFTGRGEGIAAQAVATLIELPKT